MAEGSRDYSEKAKPWIILDSSQFPFAKKLKFGSRGELDFNAIIVRERKDENNNKVIKTIQFKNTNLKQNKRIE